MAKCRSCGADIYWLRTSGKPACVNAATVKPRSDEWYEPPRHVSHWATCPAAKRWKGQPKP